MFKLKAFILIVAALFIFSSDVYAAQYPIAGKVVNTAGEPIEKITVKLINAKDNSVAASAMTDKNGNYTFKNIMSGTKYFVQTDKSADGKYIRGGLRMSVEAGINTASLRNIQLSGRPGDKAEYVGNKICMDCHMDMDKSHDMASGHSASAHMRIIMPGQKDVIEPMSGWGADNDPLGKKTGVSASPPDGSDNDPVPVTACTKKGIKGFAFGGNGKNPCVTGVFIPIAATVGGQGDKYIMPGTDEMHTNVGVFKQHYLAKLKDVPATSSWEMYPYPGADKDFIMLPLYVAQSGTDSPKFKPFRAVRAGGAAKAVQNDAVQAFRAKGTGNLRNAWVDQGQQYSQACAGCHVLGIKIKTGGEKGVYTSEFDFLEFGVGCENCHGPGSQHTEDPGKSKHIINPAALTATDEREICARCHGLALPASASPANALLYPWNDKYAGSVGHGNFIAGIHKLADFMPGWENGKGFFSWDGVHGRHHKQQSYEFELSVHVNNTTRPLTCTACHSSHSLYQGPENRREMSIDGKEYNYRNTKFNNNTVCLACHAESGSFASLSKNDIALLSAGYGQPTFLNGDAKPLYEVGAAGIGKAQNKTAAAVIKHMKDKAGMVTAAYNPLDESNPVGRCQSCHMPNTGMMGDYTYDDDKTNSSRAMIEGDVVSHVGDVVCPADVYSMFRGVEEKKAAPLTRWSSVMPTSCGKCHKSSRYYLK
ncbi:carboxypeptidase-like regulatory domain-containing protein [Geovibrio ferrireducens]|uniref:carboxypeptidase-like regulatory domain-containing protein n=1 Tax=Geovibrio ferrireducens TaxID=46201 RepID=UPI002247BC89|nr:carboxypeptidase regulatory-like domain-containing protein [Geovibrio ferrireducens]